MKITKLHLGNQVKFGNNIGIVATDKPDEYNCYNIVCNEMVWSVNLKAITEIYDCEKIVMNVKSEKGKKLSEISFPTKYLHSKQVHILGLAFEKMIQELKLKKIDINQNFRVTSKVELGKWTKLNKST